MSVFAEPSPLPYGLPPFASVTPEVLRAAFDEGMAAQLGEVAAIAQAPAGFEHTVVALERCGQALDRARRVFSLLVNSDTNDALDQLRAEYAPRFAAHTDAIRLNRDLFARLDAVHARRDELDLDPESRRLVERYHTDFVRSGAALDPGAQDRLAAINAELAARIARFGTNLLADTNDCAVHVPDPAHLAGLSADQIEAAAQAARRRGLDGYLLTLVLPTHQPALESLQDAGLRRRLLRAAEQRGARGNACDNRELIVGIAALRAERAELLGFASHSDYALADSTAGSNAALDAVLAQLIPPALANARREEAELVAAKASAEPGSPFGPEDWAYYAGRLRADREAAEPSAIGAYLEIWRTLHDGVFFAAEQLYGLRFARREDLAAHHPEARVYEVFDADGSGLGLFVADYFTRDSKRGGAWSEAVVPQARLLGQRPVVVNTMNVPAPGPGRPALLSVDEVRTMFHEFGHALHALLSDVGFPRLAGTAVARDFVEFPSQVNEMWLSWPSVREHYARHLADDRPLPAELAGLLDRDSTANAGYQTVASLAATWIDLAWHRLSADQARELDAGVEEFERRALASAGLDLATVPPRYRGPYFSHVFGGGYAAGYYSYLWSEINDADTVEWFREQGGPIRAAGEHFRRTLLSRGGSVDEAEAYREFRGRPPRIEPLLARRGLLPRV